MVEEVAEAEVDIALMVLPTPNEEVEEVVAVVVVVVEDGVDMMRVVTLRCQTCHDTCQRQGLEAGEVNRDIELALLLVFKGGSCPQEWVTTWVVVT